MKFLADINIPQSVITALTKCGHDVLDAKIKYLRARDTEIITRAGKDGRIILTRDKDFLALTQFAKFQVPTIVIRLKNQNPILIRQYVVELIQSQKEKILMSSLTIIKEDSADSYPYNEILKEE